MATQPLRTLCQTCRDCRHLIHYRKSPKARETARCSRFALDCKVAIERCDYVPQLVFIYKELNMCEAFNQETVTPVPL